MNELKTLQELNKKVVYNRNELADIAQNIQIELNTEYMSLPKDKYGEIIYIGDVMECAAYEAELPGESFEVAGYIQHDDGWYIVDKNHIGWPATDCQHFRMNTLEDLIRKAVDYALHVNRKTAEEELNRIFTLVACMSMESIIPEGWTVPQAQEILEYWPTWSDGSPCMFGDVFTTPNYSWEDKPEVFNRITIYAKDHVFKNTDGTVSENDHGGYYEWNYFRPSEEKYRPTKVDRKEKNE